ncbi:MAG: DinB family protein [bacterium]|nr:DinB family protein [bacterium]
MDRRTALAGMTAAFTGAATAAGAWDNQLAHQTVEDFKAHMRLNREYCLAFLDAMPDEHLGFKPTPEQRTFAEQLTHISNSNTYYFSRFGKETERPRPKPPNDHTRETVRNFLAASYDYVDEVLDNLTQADFERRDVPFGRNPRAHTAHDIFLRAIMHSAHHRGQAICYLRLKGIEPPKWRFQVNGVG